VLFCGTFIVSSSLEQITKCDYNSISLTDKDNRGKDSAKKKRRDVSILNSILLPNEDGRNSSQFYVISVVFFFFSKNS
jgi:hypothetical protein